jgi:type 1 fimbriae regulatory protein FimB
VKALTRIELDALLSVAEKHNPLHALMFLVTFNHGLRVSETLSLTRANIVNGYLVVQRLKGSKRTSQPLLPSERDGLLALAQNEGRFFPTYRMNFWRLMQRYGAEADIPRFKCTPHKLKHTTGRLGYEGGMGIPELQTWLGHKNGQNTMVYLQASEEQAANAFAAAIGG